MKFKKQFINMMILSTIMLMSSINVFAYNYTFGESYNNDTFGNATTSEQSADYSATENIRRDKNISLLPPSYGIFSGEFDTSQSNPYFTPNNQSSVSSVGNISNGIYATDSNGYLESTSTYPIVDTDSNVTINDDYYDRITTVSKYSDGSIGTLRIDEIDVYERIFETVDLDILAKGIGHFETTSMWDGNVGLAAHNRGSNAIFGDIDKLSNGDIIEYTTKEGARKYKVYSVKKINETDTSKLSSTYDNTITLITCVRNDRDYRWCVQGVEID